MIEWPDIQSEVSRALQNSDAKLPDSVRSLEDNKRPLKRFNVYRNNVALSLINVLKDTFPVTEKIVGEDFFKTMARDFSRDNLPQSPVMIEYGAEFPAFIKNFAPAYSLPYLSDVARLEWARTIAYNAADHTPQSIEALAGFNEADIPNICFIIHPSVSLIQSDWPVVSIWQAHQREEIDESIRNLMNKETGAKSETALVIRPHLDVLIHSLSPSTYEFLSALKDVKTFGEAVEKALNIDPAFDIPANLSGLFSNGIVIVTHLPENHTELR